MKRTPFDLLVVFLAMIPLHFASSETLPSTRPAKCHEQERSALLEFKQSHYHPESTRHFYGDPGIPRCSGNPLKLESWKLEDGDCCIWEGVECDEGTGYVTNLSLSLSCLSGPINSSTSLFHLAHLQSLNLAWNDFNSSQIPSTIGDLVELMSLNLSMSNFGGQIPAQVLKLTNLSSLDLSGNSLELTNPSMETVVQRLTKLEHLDLSRLNVSAPFPDAVANLSSLTSLVLPHCKLQGTFPTTIFELPRLQLLDLGFNLELSGHLPEFHLHSPIKSLFLWHTKFSGPLPASLGNLAFLSEFDISHSNLSGKIPSSIGNLTKLTMLNFKDNKLSGEIPSSIGKLVQLSSLDLSVNRLSGEIPASMINLTNLSFLDVQHNKLSGEISPEMCQLSSISILDLSKNKLTGVIPPCLSNLSETLYVLSLHGNDLYGRFPQLQNDKCALYIIDVSDNQLQGSLPRGLANCSSLEFLNFGNNQIVDVFPSWMGALSNLKVLILSSNRFHGAIGEPEDPDQLPKLRIVDLSMNNFSGSLPSEYFDIWSAMTVHHADDANYYGNRDLSNGGKYDYSSSLPTNWGEYDFSMTIMNKGILTEYEKIWGYLTVIDLSSNNFIGEIPNSVGSLTILHLLNLSNNALTGSIPSSLANLTELESLDLSSNKLSGMIPPALTQLNFLAFFNVSDNHLSGPIPQANQFTTFVNSYGGNLGLCGVPLTKKCGNPDEPPPAPPSGAFVEEDSRTWFEELDWKIVLMGFGSGLVIGVVMGLNTTSRIERWFLRFYGGRQRRRMHQIRFV